MAWELFPRERTGGYQMIGVDGDLLADAPIARLPVAVEITIDAPSTLPDAMARTESSIDALTERFDGSIAGTVRTSTRLVTLSYLPSDEQASEFTRVPLPAKSSVSVAPTNDPDWTLFERFRPVDMEWQSMLDLREMKRLHDAGDVGGVRLLEHAIGELDDEREEAFIAAVRSVGFEAERTDDSRVIVRHRADPADLTPDSWTIRLIAERFGATYEGWGCETLTGVSDTKRKWFGRR